MPITSTMQDVPLSIATMVRYGTTVYADTPIITYDGETTRRASLGQLGARAAQLATALRDTLGVGLGEPVATLMWNTDTHFECYLAVPAMGAVLHTLNVRYSSSQIAYSANHAEDRVVIVDADLIDKLIDVLPLMVSVRSVVVVGNYDDAARLAGHNIAVHVYEDLLEGRSVQFDWPELPETSPALMCYTSGTTGSPKGVVYSHRSVYLASMQLCMGDYLGLSVTDRALVVVPMFHVNSWNLPFAALLVGTSLILPGRHVQADHIVRLVEQLQPTISAGVPTVWNDVLHHAQETYADLSSLRDVVVGGSACPRPLIEQFEREFGVRLIQAWGMTEMSPYGSIAKPDGLGGDDAWQLRMSQGRLLCGVQARVVNLDGEVLPNDGRAVGEIETRGPWVAGAYHAKRVPDSFHDGWLRTGDVGTISERGVVTLSDRTKDVIKSGGEWISSLKLELALYSHPAVEDAAVIGVDDERWGERPWAVVVPKSNIEFDPGELADYLSTQVDAWQVPERWSSIPQIPRTSVGKSDKVRLRQMYVDRVLDIENCRARKADDPAEGSTT